MRLYIAAKFHSDNRNRPLIEAIADTLKDAGMESVSVVRDYERWGRVALTAENLMAITFRELERCDAIVIDISEKGVGLGIEAGFGFARGMPILVLAQAGHEIPKTLSGIARTIAHYDGPEGVPAALGRALRVLG
jgi:nucleoside 2-deoxyribosyltransferase